MAARKGSFRLDLPEGPVQPGITDQQVTAAFLLNEEPVPTPQSDDEWDAWLSADRRQVRGTRPTDEQVIEAIFADTHADTPDEAKGLGW